MVGGAVQACSYAAQRKHLSRLLDVVWSRRMTGSVSWHQHCNLMVPGKGAGRDIGDTLEQFKGSKWNDKKYMKKSLDLIEIKNTKKNLHTEINSERYRNSFQFG